MKKAAALLIVVLFIAIFGAVTVTATRAGLLNGIFTNNTIDAMIAEEASQSGLEAGLLDYKINGTPGSGSTRILCANLETGTVTNTGGCTDRSADIRFADVTIAPVGSGLVSITSTGHYGHVVKSHTLTQEAVPW